MKGKRKMDYTVHVERPIAQVIPELVSALERRGLRVMITFHLQLARANQVVCPHHRTERCTCQYAVLLIYSQKPGSGTYRIITAYSRDGEVWLSLLKGRTLPVGTDAGRQALGEDLLEILLSLANLSHTEVAEAGALAALAA